METSSPSGFRTTEKHKSEKEVDPILCTNAPNTDFLVELQRAFVIFSLPVRTLPVFLHPSDWSLVQKSKSPSLEIVSNVSAPLETQTMGSTGRIMAVSLELSGNWVTE